MAFLLQRLMEVRAMKGECELLPAQARTTRVGAEGHLRSPGDCDTRRGSRSVSGGEGSARAASPSESKWPAERAADSGEAVI